MPANKEIWVIGDKYMIFLAQHLEFWKEKARRNPHEAIYMLHWYDVKAFSSQSTSTNAIEVIISTLIGALNNRPKLPDIIVVMLGDTKFWCDAQALKFTMDVFITVLLQEIKRLILTRQQDLPPKAVGHDPDIYLVKLNWKPENALDSVPGYPKKRRTFNKLLDTVVRPRGAKTIMLHEVNATLDPDLFLAHGDLSEKGYRQVWKSLSEALQDFKNTGHQKKKVFSVTEKRACQFEIDSSFYSSDEDAITNHRILQQGCTTGIPPHHFKRKVLTKKKSGNLYKWKNYN